MKTIDKLEAISNKINDVKTRIEASNDLDEIKELVAEAEKLKARKNELQQTEAKVEMKNYLETDKAMHDFAKVMDNAVSTDGMRKAWNEKLKENGITVTDKDNLLPKKLELEIQTLLTRANPVFPLFKVTNMGAMLVSRELRSTDEAHVHIRGTEKKTQSASLTLSAVKPKMIYKKQSFDEIDKRTIDNFAELYELVIQELTQRVIDKIVDLALVEGTATDGETGEAEKENGFIGILHEADTDKVKHVDGTKDLVTAVEDAVDSIDAPGKKYLIITLAQKRAILNALRAKFPNAVYRNNNAELAAEFGIDEIVIYRGVKELKPIVMAEGAYGIDMQPLTRIEQFKIDTNTNDVLVETPASGRSIEFGGIAVIDLA